MMEIKDLALREENIFVDINGAFWKVSVTVCVYVYSHASVCSLATPRGVAADQFDPFPLLSARGTSTARAAAHLYGRPVSRRLSLWLRRGSVSMGCARRTPRDVSYGIALWTVWRRATRNDDERDSDNGSEQQIRRTNTPRPAV